MLANPANFAGHAYYRTSNTALNSTWPTSTLISCPCKTNYYAATPVLGDRSDPSLQQTQAMFDCLGTALRLRPGAQGSKTARKGDCGAFPGSPGDTAGRPGPASSDTSAPTRSTGPSTCATTRIRAPRSTHRRHQDLEDDRWLSRVWHADRWVRGMLNHFSQPEDLQSAAGSVGRADPSAAMPASGVAETGNPNLSAFLADGYCENGEPRPLPRPQPG